MSWPKGKPRSIETKLKMSLSMKGKKRSPETCRKISQSMMGHGFSLETRTKMSASRTGLIPGAKTRKKMSQSHLGEKNHLWKGGQYVDRDGYQMILAGRSYVREHRVIMANVIGRDLKTDEVVHHLNGKRRDNRIGNLALCNNEGTHRLVHAGLVLL